MMSWLHAWSFRAVQKPMHDLDGVNDRPQLRHLSHLEPCRKRRVTPVLASMPLEKMGPIHIVCKEVMSISDLA
jgi:hypothetical protein